MNDKFLVIDEKLRFKSGDQNCRWGGAVPSLLVDLINNAYCWPVSYDFVIRGADSPAQGYRDNRETK